MNIDIKHIAKLARLRIEDDQLDKFESEMENIVGMVEKLPDIQDEMTLDPDNPMILRKDVAVQDKFHKTGAYAERSSGKGRLSCRA